MVGILERVPRAAHRAVLTLQTVLPFAGPVVLLTTWRRFELLGDPEEVH